ncbi:MAG: MerR family transcriptional regulator [Actinomycetota bacterium]|nr:MerR family transcriptional regulator [Actinomycetota bacterium]
MKKSDDNRETRKGRLLEGLEDDPLFTIGVAARLLDCEPSMLRSYEKAGLVEPRRTEGNTRLYSENQLERMREIGEIIRDEDVNIAGARIIMQLREEARKLRKEISLLREEIASLKNELATK